MNKLKCNQTIKLHFPGSGRNYVTLGGAGGGSKEGPVVAAAGVGGDRKESSSGEGEEEGGDQQPGGAKGGPASAKAKGDKGAGNKPHLRVMIPGQKGFVSKTVSV